MRIYTYIIMSVLSFVSCNKEFDKNPSNQVLESEIFKSEEGFIVATRGLYNTLQHEHYYGGGFITYSELYTTYSKQGGYDDASLTSIAEAAKNADGNDNSFRVDATNPRLRQLWVAIYNTVRSANILLEKGKNGKPEMINDSSAWNNIRAQALTVRALAHFDLLRLFGYHWDAGGKGDKYGIPVIKVEAGPNSKPSRNTVSSTYENILSDLNEAENILSIEDNSNNPISQNDKGRNYIDIWVVRALIARVYLYKGDKENALKYADDVISNCGISLTKDLSQYYAGRNNLEESLFELSFNNQNPSFLNLTTFKQLGAYIQDLFVGVDYDAIINIFKETGDTKKQRESMFTDDDGNPKCLKYSSSPVLKDNPAYIIRLSEMYLIKAEADNFNLSNLSKLREYRQVSNPLTSNNVNGMFNEIIAELNFEGAHVMCARARLNIDKYGVDGFKGCFPIPASELNANPNIIQNPGNKL